MQRVQRARNAVGRLDGRDAATTTWFAELFERRYPQVCLDRNATPRDRSAPRQCRRGVRLYRPRAALDRIARRPRARACLRAFRRARQSARPAGAGVDPAPYAGVRGGERTHADAPVQGPHRRRAARLSAKLRLETGKVLLANTNYRLTQILERIGYDDESAFRRLFKRDTNLSPREYRRRFGGKSG